MKNVLPILLLFLGHISSPASYLTPEQSLKRLAELMDTDCDTLEKTDIKKHYIATINDKDGQPAIYVFTYSGDQGFMLLSADDVSLPLLAYSRTNSFDIHNMSPATEWWISNYATQISMASVYRSTYSVSEIDEHNQIKEISFHEKPRKLGNESRHEKESIGPLVKSEWDQWRPYNIFCPYFAAYVCPTGCVATAMAQVMNYWEYPRTGLGNISYTCSTLGRQLSMDFSSTTFNWEHILDTYDANATNQENSAVALLMKACGYSIKMGYWFSASGAMPQDIPFALIHNFKYMDNARYVERGTYTDKEWEDIIYENLTNVGPLVYSGRAPGGGGHTFVCDGYENDGYFHINWGWGGLSDGYFLLHCLNPDAIGTGGFQGGFNSDQSAILGIHPPRGYLELKKITIGADEKNIAVDTSAEPMTYPISDMQIPLTIELFVPEGRYEGAVFVSIAELETEEEIFNYTYEVKASEGASIELTADLGLPETLIPRVYTLRINYDLYGEMLELKTVPFSIVGATTMIVSPIDSTSDGKIFICDLSGKLILACDGNNYNELFNQLTPGLYIVIVSDKKGTKKCIKIKK